MDNLSHSFRRSQPPAAFAKKIYNGSNGCAAKTVYDDVFGGPPRFGVPTFSPRVEDYSEIFGAFHASRASSIPVLDLPVVDEAEVAFDVRSSKFDYSEVFGGYDGLDFAVSYEELFEKSKGAENSSDEAWTPSESEYLSEESYPSAYAATSQFFSIGDSHHSVEDIAQLNSSYNEANQRSVVDMPNGVAHGSRIHYPGIACPDDESSFSQKGRNASLKVTDDINVFMNLDGEMMIDKQFRKTKSLPKGNAGLPRSSSDGNAQKVYYGNRFQPNKAFVTISDISLKTCPSEVPPPSRPPPPTLDVKTEYSSESASTHEVSSSCAFDETSVDGSPPFFDVEVDASSSAAASAAAMMDAMDVAQAKLKSAKESLVKREIHGTSMRVGSKNDVKHMEGKEGKMVEGSDRLADDKVPEKAINSNGASAFVGKQNQEAVHIADIMTNVIEKDHLLNAAEPYPDNVRGKYSKESCPNEAIGEWENARTFYELGSDLSRKGFEQLNNDKFVAKQLEVHLQGKAKASLEVFAEIEEYNKEVIREAIEFEESKRASKAVKESPDGVKTNNRSKAANAAHLLEMHEKITKLAEETDQTENEMKRSIIWEPCSYGDKLSEADEWEGHEKSSSMQETEARDDIYHRDNPSSDGFQNENSKEIGKSGSIAKRVRKTWKLGENEKILNLAIEQADPEEELNETLNRDNCKKLFKKVANGSGTKKEDRVGRERGETKQRVKISFGPGEKEKKKEALREEENDKKLKEASEKKACRKQLKEAVLPKKKQMLGLEREKNEKGVELSFEQEENEKIVKALQQQENKMTQAQLEGENRMSTKRTGEREDAKKRHKETSKSEKLDEGLQEACGSKTMDERSNSAQGGKGTEKKSTEASEWSEVVGRSRQPHKLGKSEKKLDRRGDQIKLKAVCTAGRQTERDENEKKLKAQGNPVLMDGGTLGEFDETFKMENCKNSESTRVAHNPEKIGELRIETSDGGEPLGAVDVTKALYDEGNKQSGMTPVHLEHTENQIGMMDDGESLHSISKGSIETDIGSGQIQNQKQKEVSSSAASDSENNKMEKRADSGCDQTWKSISGTQVLDDEENNKNKLISRHGVAEQVEIVKRMEAAQSTTAQGRENSQKTGHYVDKITNSKEKKGNSISKDSDREELMRREREVELDRLRKMEEEIEREREREKDRMAVEIATSQARERAYVEARERTERAAWERASSDARQRALAEARERLEKACAEAREKSLSEKVSSEARLRFERAAVERVTAEARVRAAEKQVAEKAPFDRRETVERSLSGKHLASSRGDGTWGSSSSDLQSMGYTNGSSHPYASGYGGLEGETAQRCRARLERHRRTAERAAKALEEKNMRDFIAQKEQAERTRLAETLDAEVKRWSNGKEGNLRALLSTLQYILGPGSGWQPIPLTDVVTAVAVKKAYRKATLFVHPDKLQQRGASIQQKYICEKVFDLLKEAWSTFNSEER